MNIGLLILIVFLLIYVPVACFFVYQYSKMVDNDFVAYNLDINDNHS